mgnify:CR=1 FL=1
MPEQEILLPKIRDDLKLIETSVSEDGSKRWLLFDPIQNKYFNIGIDTFELISNWQSDIEIDEFIKILEQKNYDNLSEHNNRGRGFTIIELMLAMTFLAFIIVFVMTVLIQL